jgi:hypothetical protein
MSSQLQNEGICPRCVWGRAPCSIRDEAIVLSTCAHFIDREKKEKELGFIFISPPGRGRSKNETM